MPQPLSRRAALGGALALPFLVSACTQDDRAPATDPDRTALEAALEAEKDLYMVIANLKTGGGRAGLQPFWAVDAHVKALDAALGQAPSVTFDIAPPGSPSPPPSPSQQRSPSVDEAIRAADHAVNAHDRALRAASAEITPLIASIAASDAAVAAYLRSGTQ
ncbi:MAG: hypothetical protein ACJ73J_10510 [Actinomycetes bacterium]